jgi:hypothetical protein
MILLEDGGEGIFPKCLKYLPKSVTKQRFHNIMTKMYVNTDKNYSDPLLPYTMLVQKSLLTIYTHKKP